MNSSSLESRIQNVLMSMIQKRIIPLLLKDPLILIDQQLAEFYEKIAKQLYPTINPRYDEETGENKVLSTVVDVKILEEVLLQAVENSWDTSTLCENVSSKLLTLDIAKHIESFWYKEKDSIRESIYCKTQWSSHQFDYLKWRLDVQVLSKAGDEVNDPIALFELKTKDAELTTATTTPHNSIKFEMDRSEIEAMLTSLTEIEKKINTY